jgi:hypothetical protein
MRFREFKVETIDPYAKDRANAGKAGYDEAGTKINSDGTPGEEPKAGKKVEKTPLYPKVGFRVNIPSNQYISNEVADIQQVLIALGYNIGKTGPKGNGVDGVNGQLTRAAIGKFQHDQNITVDLKIGPETVAALNKEIAARQIHLAHSDIDSHARQVLDKANTNDNGEKVTAGNIADIHDETFKEKLIKVANDLRIAPAALWKVIKFESHGDPTQVNTSKQSTNATGLIQFTPKTAEKQFGLTVGDIKQMSNVEQLDLVYQFYKGIRPGSTAEQLYLKTIVPAFAYKDDDFVVGEKDSKEKLADFIKGKFWSQNPVFHRNKPADQKHIVTIGDIKKTFNAFKG